MFQTNWPFSGVQFISQLPRALFCVGNVLWPCTCSVCGFVDLFICLWFWFVAILDVFVFVGAAAHA
jgi:hypothetical protein